MFSKALTNLALASDIADSAFPKISGLRFDGDESLIATLRALLCGRIAGDAFSAGYSRSEYSAAAVNDASDGACINAFIGSSYRDEGSTFHIHSFCNTDEENAASFDVIDRSFLTHMPDGFVFADDLARFFEQKSIKARIFINEHLKRTIIFVERMDLRKWHFLQSLIPRFFPWWFADNPLSDNELDLLRALTNRYATSYEPLIAVFASQFNFRDVKIRNELSGFETVFEKKKLSDVQNQIKRIEHTIKSLEQQFTDYYQQLNHQRIMELGLIEKINLDHDNEFMDYFLCNKSLHLVEASGARIEFVVATTLSNFDPDMFEAIIDNEDGFFYRHYATGSPYSTNLTDEDIKKLMTAIFGTETLKLRVCAVYVLDFESGNCGAIRDYTYPPEVSDYTPNQHIQHYACLGNNSMYIRKAMQDHDYIGAVEACVSSAKNINLAENNTGTFFMERILAKNAPKIIELPDGTNVTPAEAVKWLREQEKGENHEQAD